MEGGLNASEGNGVSNRRFDEVGLGFAVPEYGLKLGTQLWLDADLGNNGRLHLSNVSHLGYVRNEFQPRQTSSHSLRM